MRLTHLKLAGFKSFVDPTTIHLHGQRVGVVGPNGCGKSNVMESVRWVLGESSAKEMRADAMDAVIFNGSSNRKPISRASVELIFDNSLGGASGEWNQYAEISVKRVIEREKGSSYYINNTAVRRRDVADLFLGTGLGGRAYAIIGQNTISRIVEAKPEELRIFLEEAAGISKYKERRRETELRLRDTRENLTRVEDICRELQKTINKLESQAVVAEKFHQLQIALKHADGQLWLLKKRDASRDWEKTKATVEKLANQLEAQIATLRTSENELETIRQAHYAASEGIQKTQASYYESNAEVANLENQLKQTEEARERMRLQLQQLEATLTRNMQQQQLLEQQLADKALELTVLQKASEQASDGLQSLMQGLPDKDLTLKEATALANASQQTLQQTKQRIQIEQNTVQYLAQNQKEVQQRITQYQQSLNHLVKPDLTELNTHELQHQQLQSTIQTIEQHLLQLGQTESTIQTQLQEMRQLLLNDERALNQAEAEIRSLEKLQLSLNQESTLAQWLSQTGLQKNARVWEKISIDQTWRTALESILGARLNALITDKPAQQRPPSALVLGLTATNPYKEDTHHAQLTSFISQVTTKDALINGALNDWLAGVYLLHEESVLDASLALLKPGECLVNARGDIFTPNSVTYHGAHTQLQGVLERQQLLETLKAQLPALHASVEANKQKVVSQEQSLANIKQQQQLENAQQRKLTAELHALQLQVSRLKQSHENALQRETAIGQEQQAAEQKLQEVIANIEHKQHALDQLIADMPQQEQQANLHARAKQLAETAYFALRDDIQKSEKTHQEFVFNLKILNNLINDLTDKLKVINEEKTASILRQSETESVLSLTPMETLKANLLAAVNHKQLAEANLAAARNHLAEQDEKLQAQERLRLQYEQQLHPLRDMLEQSRLKEQEARLHFEQCLAGLQSNGLSEDVLEVGLDAHSKTSELANKTIYLQRDITALGAVNLAAIQELATEKERKHYLDSQMLDLSQASQTLEDAIRKIDKETRGKLQATFDEANRNFNELFNVLFGGGQAKLELLGDEILDTGIQVFAQPPGKKNTTIQLLSGGEKALTAMALVFALFRLNPAPFCLMDEVDAPLDDSNTERFCSLVKKMSERTQFLFVSHNKITMEMAQQLIGVTMQESGVSRIVDVDIDAAMRMQAA
ncbi:MAG: chromosome segregation protein SMC [Methylophilales bacterium 28-44-11]|nr:MAG: chromosome segregation protein SMC [Methylophilales bacterium 28-44-11]